MARGQSSDRPTIHSVTSPSSAIVLVCSSSLSTAMLGCRLIARPHTRGEREEREEGRRTPACVDVLVTRVTDVTKLCVTWGVLSQGQATAHPIVVHMPPLIKGPTTGVAMATGKYRWV